MIIILVINSSCKKPFNLSVTSNYTNILVVEGTINTSGVDSTFIKLSRTGKVSSATIDAETKATVTIENAQGTVLNLTERISGIYSSPPIVLDNAKQYRVRIQTSNGEMYISDFVDVKITPPIDSVGYAIKGTGVQIYANTHDPDNNTHYYKYSFGETWQFNSAYPSSYIFSYQDTDIVVRTPAQQVQSCFGRDSSSHTIIYSTAALNQDVVYQAPITTVDDTTEKLETKYSILVTQQALTKEAFAFYENLQKNTEGLGSIFDAQPSQLIGNIHSVTNPTESIVGFISAGTTQQKRIYIVKTALPQAWHSSQLYGCEVDTAYYFPNHRKLRDKLMPLPSFNYLAHLYWVEIALFPATNDMLYAGRAYGEAIDIVDTVGYTFSTTRCVDCTVRGTTKQPAFWK